MPSPKPTDELTQGPAIHLRRALKGEVREVIAEADGQLHALDISARLDGDYSEALIRQCAIELASEEDIEIEERGGNHRDLFGKAVMVADGGQSTQAEITETRELSELQQRLGGKGVPIERTGDDCPHCDDGELVKPRSEVVQCPDCLFVNNPGYMDTELRDFELTHRQGRLLLRAFGQDFHGTAGDIGSRLRQFCEFKGVDRAELNALLNDVSATEATG